MSVIQRNNVNVSGNGTVPMLFAHGFGCDQEMWRYVAPTFEKDYKVIRFDYVGHGRSDRSAYNAGRYQSLRGYAQDVLDICHELALKDVIFVGHSVSSMVGMLAAIEAPGVFSKLIMIGPSPCYINEGDYTGGFEKSDIDSLLHTMDKNYIGWANYLAPVIMSNPDKPELAAELAESFCSTDPVIARQFAQVTFLSDNREDLHKLKTPSLILQCSNDLIAPATVGEYLAKNLRDTQLRTLAATGHCPQMSAPQETIDAIQTFLKAA